MPVILITILGFFSSHKSLVSLIKGSESDVRGSCVCVSVSCTCVVVPFSLSSPFTNAFLGQYGRNKMTSV